MCERLKRVTARSSVISARARRSSYFSGFTENLRLIGSTFPSRRGEGPNVLAVGLFFSKTTMRYLTDTLGAAREARCVEGRACSSTCAVSGLTNCSLPKIGGVATICSDTDLGVDVFGGSGSDLRAKSWSWPSTARYALSPSTG